MEFQVNWLAVVLAALSTMVVGSIWYSPKVFGNKWMKLIGKSEKELGKNKSAATQAILITLVVSFLSAYILASFAMMASYYYGVSLLQGAGIAALWGWLGFTAARFITHDAFEQRPSKLTWMNVGHEFVTFGVMALIIGLLPA